jgi:transcriptional repressor NrdR
VRCPFCGRGRDRVVDSREAKDGKLIRRRRECLHCHRRFTSYERIEDIPFMVIKRDSSRETFDRGKLMGGLLKAVEKRPVGTAVLEDIVNEIEGLLHEAPNRELPTARIGEAIMRRLRDVDQVAYVRFASVYRRFEDATEFMHELKDLLEKGREGGA